MSFVKFSANLTTGERGAPSVVVLGTGTLDEAGRTGRVDESSGIDASMHATVCST